MSTCLPAAEPPTGRLEMPVVRRGDADRIHRARRSICSIALCPVRMLDGRHTQASGLIEIFHRAALPVREARPASSTSTGPGVATIQPSPWTCWNIGQ